MLSKLKSQLYALQILEYDPWVFLNWLKENPGFYPKEVKARLVWTPKIIALFSLSLLIQLIISGYLLRFGYTLVQPFAAGDYLKLGLLVYLLLFSLLTLAELPVVLILPALLSFYPLELAGNWLVIQKAERKLKRAKNLKVIGIAGSFAKTSVKLLLQGLLSDKFKVVATPQSYNKILSIAQTINRSLTADTEIFIVEAGAYAKGEIQQICRLINPQVGIVTGLTQQHLSRFGSFENIQEAKNELIQSLPNDGLAVFNLDNEPSRELYEKCPLEKIGYSIKETPIEISTQDTTFQAFGQKVTTTLLGRQNVLNILGAAAVAKFLGLAETEILERIPLLHPVPHRLELIRGVNQALIIDDAYSSNLEGYQAAFEVVASFKNYPKVLVTPGLVELGRQQNEENFRLSRSATGIFDYLIFVNKENRSALVAGALAQSWTPAAASQTGEEDNWVPHYRGIEKDKVFYLADSLNEVVAEILPKLSKPFSLILLENDLPDVYQ